MFASRVLIILILLVCFYGNVGVHAENNTVRVQLRWHHQFQFAGYYAAIEKGFYQDAGLTVELNPIKKGITPLSQVIDGHADFSQGDMGLLMAQSETGSLVALAATFQYSPSIFLFLKSANIQTPNDLVGKKVMMFPGYENLVLYSLLNQFHLVDKIERLDSSTQFQDLISGNTDVFNAYSSNEPYLLEKLGIEYNYLSPQDFGVEFYGDVIFTSKAFLDKHPLVVERFVEATLAGWKYAMSHPEEMIDVISNVYKAPKSKDHLRFEANALREAMMPDLIPVGHMNFERWENTQRQLLNVGLLKQPVNLNQFIYSVHDEKNKRNEMIKTIAVILVVSILLSLFVHYFRNTRKLALEVNKRKIAEQKALDLALHDPLTGLPNRLLLKERLQWVLSKMNREGIQPLLLFIDLDNFKQVNDGFGHESGDALLNDVARALESITRENDTCARFAGDEFVLLTEHCDNLAEAELIATRAVNALINQFKLSDPTDLVSVSIGALLIDELTDESTAYQLADQLMYQSKGSPQRVVVNSLSNLKNNE